MRPALRYAIAVGVGLVVTVLAAESATTDHLLILSLVPLYTALTSLILAHKERWLRSYRSSPRPARKRGAVIGGVGAFTGSLLLQASIPAGIAGLGLMLLGMAEGIAEFTDS